MATNRHGPYVSPGPVSVAPGSLPGGVLRQLADDIGGVLVVAQALEPRVAQLPVGGPLTEAHLGDQAGLDPVHAGAGQAAAAERGVVLLQVGQHRVQGSRVCWVKPVPTLPA